MFIGVYSWLDKQTLAKREMLARKFPGQIFRFTPSCLRLLIMEFYSKYMKALLYAQINPSKTLGQIINDRNLYRVIAVFALILAWCR